MGQARRMLTGGLQGCMCIHTAGVAQHCEPGEGDLQARLVSDQPQTRPGRQGVPLHPHAVLPGREVAQARAALPRGPAVLPAHKADAGDIVGVAASWTAFDFLSALDDVPVDASTSFSKALAP